MRDSLPLSTFSFLANHRRERNLPPRPHGGNHPSQFRQRLSDRNLWSPPPWAATRQLLAVSSRDRHPHRLAAALRRPQPPARPDRRPHRRRRARPRRAESDSSVLEDWLGNSAASAGPRFDPNSALHHDRQARPVELSPDIVWRLRPLENSRRRRCCGPPPITTSAAPTWQNQRVAVTRFQGPRHHRARHRRDLSTSWPETCRADAQKQSIRADLPRFNLRGSRPRRKPRCRFPAMPPACATSNWTASSATPSAPSAFSRSAPSSRARCFWKGDTNPENPPDSPAKTCAVPTRLETARPAGRRCRNSGSIEQPTLQSKLAVIRAWFRRNFKYSRNLTIRGSMFSPNSLHGDRQIPHRSPRSAIANISPPPPPCCSARRHPGALRHRLRGDGARFEARGIRDPRHPRPRVVPRLG